MVVVPARVLWFVPMRMAISCETNEEVPVRKASTCGLQSTFVVFHGSRVSASPHNVISAGLLV